MERVRKIHPRENCLAFVRQTELVLSFQYAESNSTDHNIIIIMHLPECENKNAYANDLEFSIKI